MSNGRHGRIVRIGALGLGVLAACLFPAAASFSGQTVPLAPAPQGQTADGDYVPVVGQGGKDVVWVPSAEVMVETMLDLAKVTRNDLVMDLGSGDGRNVVAAAKRGARGLGVEFNPDLVRLSRRTAQEAGVAERAQFIEGDMYAADISKATVMALFLLPTNLDRLKDKFLALPPGTRLAMNTFTLDGWEPDASVRIETNCTSWCHAYLLIVPANIAGTWAVDGGQLVLAQEYREVTGTWTPADGPPVTVAGKVSASEVSLTFGERAFSGRAEGNRLTGTVTEGRGVKRAWRASR